MADASNELMLEILKKIQSDISDVKKGQFDLKEAILGTRDDIHGVRGDIRRQERAIASLEHDMERIKIRLDLVDTP